MKTLTSPYRLMDGRRLRNEGKNALGHQVWRASGGLTVTVSVEPYGNHLAVSVEGRKPSDTDVKLVQAAFFDEAAVLITKPVALSGIMHVIEAAGPTVKA